MKEGPNRLDPKIFADIKGVGTVILNKKDEVLVGTETEDKPLHRRLAGMISIPIETVKPFERRNRRGLVLASLAEVVTDGNLAQVSEGLLELGIIDQPVVVDKEHDIKAAVSVFRWDGDPQVNPFSQAQPDLAELRWMSQEEILAAVELRPYAEVILAHARTNGYLNGRQALPRTSLAGLFPSRHAIARESKDDVSK